MNIKWTMNQKLGFEATQIQIIIMGWTRLKLVPCT
jgi:hypothetical protein